MILFYHNIWDDSTQLSTRSLTIFSSGDDFPKPVNILFFKLSYIHIFQKYDIFPKLPEISFKPSGTFFSHNYKINTSFVLNLWP